MDGEIVRMTFRTFYSHTQVYRVETHAINRVPIRLNNVSRKVEVGHDRHAAIAVRQGQNSCRPQFVPRKQNAPQVPTYSGAL